MVSGTKASAGSSLDHLLRLRALVDEVLPAGAALAVAVPAVWREKGQWGKAQKETWVGQELGLWPEGTMWVKALTSPWPTDLSGCP